jgi:FixJ family two-component response regulator
MFPHLIIIDDEPAVLNAYTQDLRSYGFESIECIEQTDGVVDRIAVSYTGPSLLICDYCIQPMPPARYLPELHRKGIEIPAIIVSGRIDAMQVNELCLHYPIRGFFEKTHKFKSDIAMIAKHLVDLGAEARAAFERFRLRQEAYEFIASLDNRSRKALLRLLGMEDVKKVAPEEGVGSNAVYTLRTRMQEFLGLPVVTERYVALDSVLRERIER